MGAGRQRPLPCSPSSRTFSEPPSGRVSHGPRTGHPGPDTGHLPARQPQPAHTGSYPTPLASDCALPVSQPHNCPPRQAPLSQRHHLLAPPSPWASLCGRLLHPPLLLCTPSLGGGDTAQTTLESVSGNPEGEGPRRAGASADAHGPPCCPGVCQGRALTWASGASPGLGCRTDPGGTQAWPLLGPSCCCRVDRPLSPPLRS